MQNPFTSFGLPTGGDDLNFENERMKMDDNYNYEIDYSK